MKNELIEVTKNGVSAYELYLYLEVSTKFSMWFSRRVQFYGFTEGSDFVPFLGLTTVGRQREDYILSIDMAKELAMLEKTPKGKEIRKYLIDVENKYRSQLVRDSSKLTRRGFTELLVDSGENERMHGFGIASYTKLIYKKLGIEYIKQNDFRSTLSVDQLKAIEALEKMADGYLQLGYDYNSIKEALPDFIVNKQKEIEDADVK